MTKYKEIQKSRGLKVPQQQLQTKLLSEKVDEWYGHQFSYMKEKNSLLFV